MKKTTHIIIGVLGLCMLGVGGQPLLRADQAETAKLLAMLPASKQTLAQGIEQASAKAPEVAISAKFEVGDDGKLSLSVYTAEKGVAAGAEGNVLKELSGSPEAAKWTPETEVFKDVPHVSRASEQLTLMALSKFSLADILAKAKADQAGTIYAITPVLRERKPEFVVLVAADGKSVELRYDLITGERRKQ